MTLRHVVVFRWKEGTTATEIEAILRRAIRQIADREITSLAVLRSMQTQQ